MTACSSSSKSGEGMFIGELRWQDPRTETYLGSPSLVRLPDGAILASHDYFGPHAPFNHEGEEFLTTVYRSEDDGRTWKEITHLSHTYWASLFEHRGSAYILGTSAHNRDIVIRRSDDGGYTWTVADSDTTGLLFVGGPSRTSPNYHCAPVPVLVHEGRIWRAFEDNLPHEEFARGFQALVISASVDSDLLRADSWRMSNKLQYDGTVDPPEFGDFSGWLEGNVVADRNGQVWDVLRVNSYPVLNKAAMVHVSDEGRTLEFDAETGFIDLPGGASKFTIRWDDTTELYWTISNDMQDEPVQIRRNRLSLFSSPDLANWTKRMTLLEDHLETSPEESVQNTGFQYVDWQFDGDGIMYLVRTAYDGAHNFHDSNRINFCRTPDLRTL